jgi:hypothetical protein
MKAIERFNIGIVSIELFMVYFMGYENNQPAVKYCQSGRRQAKLDHENAEVVRLFWQS